MLPIDAHHNYADCGGPSRCDYCAGILSETPERGYQRRTAEDRVRGLRTASPRAEPDYTPPDPYAEGIRKLRADLPTTNRWPDPPVVPSTTPGDYTPPDPYAAALDKLRKENR